MSGALRKLFGGFTATAKTDGVPAQQTLWTGLYRGTVISVQDPQIKGRVLVNVPRVYGLTGTWWAECCLLGAGDGHGVKHSPQVGDGAWVAFEEGYAARPILLGYWYGRPMGMPELPEEFEADPEYVRGWVTPAGLKVILNDDPEGRFIRLEHPNGSIVEWNESGQLITVQGNVTEEIRGSKKTTFKGNLTQTVSGALMQTIIGKAASTHFDKVAIYSKEEYLFEESGFPLVTAFQTKKGIARKGDKTEIQDPLFTVFAGALDFILQALLGTIPGGQVVLAAYNQAKQIAAQTGVGSITSPVGKVVQGSGKFYIKSGDDTTPELPI